MDQQRQPGRFVLTGSANVLLLPRLSDSLAGRMEILPLYPLAQSELARKPPGFPDQRTPQQSAMARASTKKSRGVCDTKEKRPACAGLEVGPVLAWGPGREVRPWATRAHRATEESAQSYTCSPWALRSSP
ncbi:MAG: AAA family ATPase [Acidiferrobacteraceae bacterium]